MARCLYDPPPTDDEYERMVLTRPLTGPALGNPRRSGRDARLSALMAGRERPRPGVRVVQSPWTGRQYLVRR